MKEWVPSPPPLVHNEHQNVQELFHKYVVPSYGRFDLVFKRGEGSFLWDARGKRYLDLGGGIAVCSLGHSHPEITQALIEQSRHLLHVSNLYYHEPQGRLAARIVKQIAPGKVFFSNSGAEANEGLFKLARKFGHEEGRFEILTATNSFHGRTLAGIAATGQDKVKKGFDPMVPGFRHVPFNDLEAVESQLSPSTVAILIEGIQGEGGITPATPEYLLGLRRLCDEHNLLLMMDAVQCGHFRTGRFQSFQRILENTTDGESFLPDAISMAKSLGGGFPIGAFWVQEKHGDLLGPGTHGTTFGGTPLGCAVAMKIFEVIEREKLADNVRQLGDWIRSELEQLQKDFPDVITRIRGMGFMIGVELASDIPAFADSGKPSSMNLVNRLHEAGVMTIPSGANVFRLLPALNLKASEAEEGLSLIRRVIKEVAG